MPQVTINISEEIDSKVRLYMAKHKIKNKAYAIKELLEELL